MEFACTKCSRLIDKTNPFCQFCGARNDFSDTPITLWEKLKIGFLSVLLFPLGLYWFFKYFKNENIDKRRLGYISLAITVLILFWFAYVLTYAVHGLKTYTSSLESELDTYSQLGF